MAHKGRRAMTRKDVRNIKQMHSKRTGAIILITLTFFLVGSAVFVYLAMEENNKFEIELDNFQLLSCDFMEYEILKDKNNDNIQTWKQQTLSNKISAGECVGGNSSNNIMVARSCADLFQALENMVSMEDKQKVHDQLKRNDC